MDGVKKNLSEGVPLNSPGAANIFLNTGKKSKVNDGTIIHLNTEKPADVGVHINTTLSIASSKKMKLLFMLNFLLSIICMIISCSVAFYYWNEMFAMRRQLDILRDQFLTQNLKDNVIHQEKILQNPFISNLRPQTRSEFREARMDIVKGEILSPNTRKYYVEDLGDDMLLIDSSKKQSSHDNVPVQDLSVLLKDPLVVQFNGAMDELHMGTQSFVGPWVRDSTVSTKNSETKIELHTNYISIKEDGVFLVYGQIVYLTHAPNAYYIFARLQDQEPRLVSACATGDDSSSRPLDKSQISCSFCTVARLYKGDTLNFAQREQNRTLWLRRGYTYFGFVKLSS